MINRSVKKVVIRRLKSGRETWHQSGKIHCQRVSLRLSFEREADDQLIQRNVALSLNERDAESDQLIH